MKDRNGRNSKPERQTLWIGEWPQAAFVLWGVVDASDVRSLE